MESPEQRFERNWQPRLWISLALLILVVGYLIAFVVGNNERTQVDFVFGQAQTSLIWVILISLLGGLVGGVLVSQLHRRRRSRAAERDQTSEASSDTPSSISDGDA